MKKVYIVLFCAFIALLAGGCEKDAAEIINNPQSNQTEELLSGKDTIFYHDDETGTFDLLAETKSGMAFAVKEDTVRGCYATVVTKEGIPEDSALVLYSDSVGKVFRIYNKEFCVDINYHTDDNMVDYLITKNDSVILKENCISPYSITSGFYNQQTTRAGSVLTPTTVLSSIVSFLTSVGTSSGRILAEAGIGGTIINNGLGATISLVAGTVGVVIAGGGVALTIASLLVILNAAGIAVDALQNEVAKHEFGNAYPVIVEYARLSQNSFGVAIDVNDVSYNKQEFYIGAILADGLFITKKHNLKEFKQTYWGDKTYTFIFDGLFPNHVYKTRAFLESSQYIRFSDYLDYWRYSPVVNGIRTSAPITISEAKQVLSEKNGSRYNFTVSVKASCNQPLENWGIAIFEGALLDTPREIQKINKIKYVGDNTFELSFSIPEAWMNTSDPNRIVPELDWYAVPYCKFYDIENYDGSSKFKLDLVYGAICPDENHPHAIDLGLPSGTKWCCMNVGATSPEDYGGHYAWGETNEKKSYSEGNYQYCYYTWNKYDYEYVYRDIGSDIAGTSYDVAHSRMGGSWRMPNHEQQMELMDHCTQTWTDHNGVYGVIVKGLNGGQIFLPAAGFYSHAWLESSGGACYYWSSSLASDYNKIAYYLKYWYQDEWKSDVWYRCYGYSVRAVCP